MSAPWRDAAPAPRGPYYPAPPFPHAPPPPPLADNPFAGVSRQSYFTPVPGFYSPSLAQPPPGLPVRREAPAPAFPRPELPPSLMPGRKSTYDGVSRSQSNDYFFKNVSPTSSNYARTTRTSLGTPPVPRKPDLRSPPLPPKPSFSPPPSASRSSPPRSYSRSNPRASSYPTPENTAQPSAPPLPPPVNHEDDAVLHRVLAQSAQESQRQRQEFSRSEEEELSLAMEASLQIRPNNRSPDPDGRSYFLSSSPEQRPGAFVQSPVLDISFNSLREMEQRQGSSRPYVVQQIRDDEALALQIAQEEQQLAERERTKEQEANAPHRGSSASAHSRKMSQMAGENGLPQYDDPFSSPRLPGSPDPSIALQQQRSQAGSPQAIPPRQPSLGRSASDKPIPQRSTSPEQMPLNRSQSIGDLGPNSSMHMLSPTPPVRRPMSAASSDWESPEETLLTPSSMSSHTSEMPSPNQPSPNGANQYLDAELLSGLSMGFGIPMVSTLPRPFPGVIPNVIALPYGRCPPFHMKASSWRSLLKLMARLSGTRMEPTMEAMAVVKTEMKLRIVVSFVKVHQSSSDWDTVLYMSIDHPVPPNAPTGWKYRNGDTNSLPWSYTLSQVPPFLRDGADAPLSKFYTIPCTNDMPYPTLPISFPNLATYLASALENSRDAMHDSSSSVRRLAKCIDQFYPNDRVGLDDAPERAGMRQRLKNLVGIGSKPQRDRNAEMYELVTPFVPDEYGR